MYASDPQEGYYEIEVACIDYSNNKNYFHFGLSVFKKSKDKETVYYTGVFIAILACLIMAAFVMLESAHVYWFSDDDKEVDWQ